MLLIALLSPLVALGCSDDDVPAKTDGAVRDAVVDQHAGDARADNALGDASADLPAKDLAHADLSSVDGPGPDAIAGDLSSLDLPAGDASKIAFCQQLDASYVKAVTLAKQCSPMLPVIHCQKLVTSQLICPCTPDKTYVESAPAALTQLEKQFNAAGCAALFPCPKIACWTPTSASCASASGTATGTCTDGKP